MSRLPIIGVTACSSQTGLNAYHISGDIHINAVAALAQSLSVIFPSLADQPSLSVILDGFDGTPITVTPFNIEPIHNSGSAFVQGTARDSAGPVCAEVHTSAIAWRKLAFHRDADASTTA
ncbi:gamma-glutamyl-gamma-aminobutyrate hydrolase family protein [Pseudomonas sp. NPDC087336]|uniref:gamma-glutamyl-gamma-aminobutyrate hydrolase family protein n=1 Tax=Pseudomonas sp. NPDC087336 TaxID=3364436 RepID=UPI003819B68F